MPKQQRKLSPIYKADIRPEILVARGEDLSIKLFYAKMRELREQGATILDVGSSVKVDDLEKPQIDLVIDNAHRESKERELYTEYSSSWGLMDLRLAAVNYFRKWGDIVLDHQTEIMVTRGIIDSFSRVVRSFAWKGVIIPDWSPYYARSKAIISCLPVHGVETDMKTGNLKLDLLRENFLNKGLDLRGQLLYITHPASPTGTLMDDKFIEDELLPFCKMYGVSLFCDSYICATQFDGGKLRPILSYTGAKEICIEAITVAKELGIPGARAGAIAGSDHLINRIRLLAATEVDIVPGYSQLLAAKALTHVKPEVVGARVRRELEEEILPRFKRMKWPVIKPKAGIDMVIEVPPGFRILGIQNPSLLAAMTILRKYGVAMCPCSVFGPEGKNYLRLVLKQKIGELPEALDKLKNDGFCWKTEAPTTEDIKFLQDELDRLDMTRL